MKALRSRPAARGYRKPRETLRFGLTGGIAISWPANSPRGRDKFRLGAMTDRNRACKPALSSLIPDINPKDSHVR
jgi:hypothetical protein